MSESTGAPPVPPDKPLPGDCCESGCDVCVFDAYAEALDRYRKALAQWSRGDTGVARPAGAGRATDQP